MARMRGGPRSQRQERVGELLRHTLSGILMRGDVHDPDLEGLSITVSEVEVSPDLKNAHVFFTPLGGSHGKEVEDALNRNVRFIRGQLGHEITLKFTPRLRFELDRSFDQAEKIDRLLHDPRVRQDIEPDEDEDGNHQDGGDSR